MKRFLLIVLALSVFCLPMEARRRWIPKAPSGGSTLLTNIFGYWKLNEVSGTRADSTANATTLTDNNATLSNTGHVSTPAAFFVTATSQSLSHAAATAINTGDIDFSLTCWVYLDAINVNQPIVQKGWDDAYGEYIIYIASGTNKPKFQIANGAGTVENTGTTAFTTGTWYFVCATYNAATDTMSVSTNGGTPDTATYAGGNTTVTGNFKIGTGVGAFYGGRIQEVGFWKKVLSPTEIATLYASGAGLTYPF